MPKALTRTARWHRMNGCYNPYSHRRLTAKQFAAHDLVMNSEIDRAFVPPLEAFEIRFDDFEDIVLGIAWSTPTPPLPHGRQRYTKTWHTVSHLFEVQYHGIDNWDRTVQQWWTRDKAAEAMMDAERNRRLLRRQDLERDKQRAIAEAALADFYV